MATKLNPYLNFRGDAREAVTFYQSVLGGEVTINTFADFGGDVSEAEKDQVMHSQLESDDLTLMVADVPSNMDLNPGSSISISLSGDDEERLTGYYHGLSEGGQILEPLAKAPWGDSFGMFTDRFGIQWMVNIAGEAS